MILATKGKDKESRKQLKQGSKNISFFYVFVNSSTITPAFSSKEVHTISNMWGSKMSNNNDVENAKKTMQIYRKCIF
jgi:hypothetical protein